ncbi:ABC transporter substrate-binding protein [Arboricoccus pini]|uniref:ABC transporter substrate-binding protein n=1 Tax=Arboricoccus pini TaxID=1963835 RepID=UPI003898F386
MLLSVAAASFLPRGAEAKLDVIPDDTLVIGQGAEPRSLDPAVATSLNDFRLLANMYDGLVRTRDQSLELEPSLAESWTIDKDASRYVFSLRENLTFQDGAALDANAIKWNFERMLDADHPAHDTGPFPLAFFFAQVQSIEAPDRQTVIFNLKEAFAPFLSNLAYPSALIVSPQAVMQDKSGFGRRPIGSGPFRFERWESRRQIVLARNKGYWRKEARLKRLVFRPITDANARLSELLAGNLDVLVEVPPDSTDVFRRTGGFQFTEQVGPHLWYVILDAASSPFNDVRVRQAVNFAVNKQAIVDDLLQGTATVAAGPIPAAFSWATDPSVQPYPYDPDRARALLQSAGYDRAQTITFYVPDGGSGMLDPVGMATAIQADLAAVDMRVRIQTYEWNTFLAKVNGGLAGSRSGDGAKMAEMAWMTNDPDTIPFLTLRSDAGPAAGGFNSGAFADAELDKLILAARKAEGREERAALYRQIGSRVHEAAPWIFVASWKQNAVLSRFVEGLTLQPSFLVRFEDVAKLARSDG